VSKELAVAMTIAAGGLAAAQAPANNIVSQKVGDVGAVGVNFVCGTLILVAAFLIVGGVEIKEGVATPAWYYWVIGGLSGVGIVLAGLIGVRQLGATGVTVAIISGQLVLSVILDRLGVLGLDERAVTVQKLLGIALLAAGTVLVVHE
jgi:bacterial/archaeal transporter family-2 protein